MPRTLLISKLRNAAERLDLQRESSGIEPDRHVRGQPSSRQWKWSLPIVGVLALLGLAGWQSVKYWWGMQNGAKYRMAKVERSTITAYISATGTLNPVIMVQVGTQVSGTIEKLFADFNSTVVPGQQLAQLDQASFRAKVLQAEANLDTARAEVKNALANVHNVRASIETARADMASRSAQRERARVAIADTKRILERQQALFTRALLPRNEVETAQTAYDTAVAQYNAAPDRVLISGFISSSLIRFGRALYGVRSGLSVKQFRIGVADRSSWFIGGRPSSNSIVLTMPVWL